MRVIRLRAWHICILCAVIAAAVLLFLNSNAASPAVEEENMGSDMIIDNEMIRVLITESLAEYLPVRELTASISGDGRVALSGVVSPDELMEALRKSDVSLPTTVRLFMRLLPDRTRIEGVLRLAVDSENRSFSIDVEKLLINGMELGENLIPESVSSALGASIGAYLEREGIKLGLVEFRDGEIRIMS